MIDQPIDTEQQILTLFRFLKPHEQFEAIERIRKELTSDLQKQKNKLEDDLAYVTGIVPLK